MPNCEYKEVQNCTGDEENFLEQKKSWVPLLRQTLICSGIWTIYFQTGIILGIPTVLIPQLRREANSTDFINDEQASWISCAVPYAVVIWTPILTVLAWYFGRRKAHAIIVVVGIAGFVALYFSNTVLEIIISMTILSTTTASVTTIGVLVLTEYSSPEYRGFFLAVKTANAFWGMWVANAIGTFFHWKYIIVTALCCSIYNLIALLGWSESPYWLASQGQREESRIAFFWLRGHNENNKKEFEELMQVQKNCKISMGKSDILELWKIVSSKWFYKPLMLAFLLLSQYQLSGKLIVSVYAIDIIKKITKSERNAYIGMLILDGVTVLGMYCGSYLVRHINRRVQLITGTGGGIVGLLLMSLYLYLIQHSIMFENIYIPLTLLSISALFISCGPVLLSVCIVGELMPLKMRSSAVACSSILASLTVGTAIKVGPQLFRTFGLDGGFLFFGLSSTACLILLYTYLPETRDKSLIEIAQLIQGSTPQPKGHC